MEPYKNRKAYNKRLNNKLKGDDKTWYHPDSPEAKKQGEEMYNMIMGEETFSIHKSEEERKKRTKESMKEYYARIAREYLEEHPEELIKIRDEGLIKEMVDFAAKQTGQSPLAVTEAPTEEEVYLAKREAEGRPLIETEEAGAFPSAEQIRLMKEESKELDNHFNSMSDEAQDRLVEAINTVNNALHNHPHARAHKRPAGSDWDIDKKEYEESKERIKVAIQNEKDIKKEIKLGGATTYPLKSSAYCVPQSDIKDRPQDWNIEYVGGHDPIDDDNRVNLARVEKDGTVKYINKKGEIVRTFKDGSLIKNEEPKEEEDDKEVYHTSLMEANSRTALVMMIVVFLVILAYLLWQ